MLCVGRLAGRAVLTTIAASGLLAIKEVAGGGGSPTVEGGQQRSVKRRSASDDSLATCSSGNSSAGEEDTVEERSATEEDKRRKWMSKEQAKVSGAVEGHGVACRSVGHWHSLTPTSAWRSRLWSMAGVPEQVRRVGRQPAWTAGGGHRLRSIHRAQRTAGRSGWSYARHSTGPLSARSIPEDEACASPLLWVRMVVCLMVHRWRSASRTSASTTSE